MTLKKSWNNNVTIHVVFNEYLHNEYRRSFIEIHHKFCDLMEYDKFIGPMVKSIGLFCPLPVRTLRITNFSFPLDKFPNVFPFEKCRIDSELTVTATNESMIIMYHYVTFKNMKKT
ncbi:uncharacterized protein LOC116767591 [Danaus plexippus]|uniref:uncharacterized protein LOC116767591 n=1 Tax=Danaus plexippus TaxID=13037 RepID=UPI002AAFEFA9|nr:uncharacterized protein LOC116767591 [Danaus plexippus]